MLRAERIPFSRGVYLHDNGDYFRDVFPAVGVRGGAASYGEEHAEPYAASGEPARSAGTRTALKNYLPAVTVGACHDTPSGVTAMVSGPSAPSFRKGPEEVWSLWALSV